MLAASNRLRLRKDFTVVYARGDRYYGKYLKLRVYSTKNLESLELKVCSDILDIKVGIVVSKKVSKKAVVRNRIRRQLRAIFRSFLPQLNQQLINQQLNQGLQIVITVVTVSTIPSYKELQEDLINLFSKFS